MSVLASGDIEKKDFNFDRYDAQLTKISKGNTLSKFAMDTVEQELKRMKEIVSISTFSVM